MVLRISLVNFHEFFSKPEVREVVPELIPVLDEYVRLLRAGSTGARRRLVIQTLRSLSAEQKTNIEAKVGRIKLIAPDERIVFNGCVPPIDLHTYLNSLPKVRDVTIARDADHVYISSLR